MRPDDPPRLPIALVIQRSFAYAWESRRILGPPYLIYAAITTVADLLLGYAAGSDNSTASYLGLIAEEIFAMAFAVGVHRYVLLGEAPPGFRFFRWDRNFSLYVLTMLILALGAGIVLAIAAGAAGNFGSSLGLTDPGGAAPANAARAGAIGLLLALAMVATAVALSRLSLALPAAALGEQHRFQRIWAATRGNGFRLFATTVMILLPFVLVQLVLLRVGSAEPAQVPGILAQIAVGLVSPLQLIVLTVMLSLDYDVLVRRFGP